MRFIHVILLACLLTGIAAAKGPSMNVHVFYYPWYANPETDGHWSHWNHPYPDGNYWRPGPK
jgi:hypothetical protein